MSDLQSSDCRSFVYGKMGFYIYRKKGMIYLQNTTESQFLFVPKSMNRGFHVGGLRASGAVMSTMFVAKSTIDLAWEIQEQVHDMGDFGLYYVIEIHLPAGIPDGEYEYTLRNNINGTLSTGLLVIGEKALVEEYNKEIVYEQYSSE